MASLVTANLPAFAVVIHPIASKIHSARNGRRLFFEKQLHVTRPSQVLNQRYSAYTDWKQSWKSDVQK